MNFFFLLLQPTRMKFKQQNNKSSGMEEAPRRDKLHFSDLLYICIFAYLPYIDMLQFIDMLPSVTYEP